MPGEALGFGVVLAVASVLLMYLATNIAGGVGAGAIDPVLRFRLHDVAEAPHAAEHCHRRRRRRLPAGDRLGRGDRQRSTLMPLILFAIVFFWTPPHFWSLALWANDDYRRAGVPMLPVVAGAQGDAAADRALHAAAGAAVAAAVGLRLRRAGLRRRGVGARRGLPVAGRAGRCAIGRTRAGVSLTNDAPAKAAFKYSIALPVRCCSPRCRRPAGWLTGDERSPPR